MDKSNLTRKYPNLSENIIRELHDNTPYKNYAYPESITDLVNYEKEDFRLKAFTFLEPDSCFVKTLLTHTSKSSNMKWIGDGKPWDKKKILSMIQQAKEDLSVPMKERKYFDFLVLACDKVVGYISLKPQKGLKDALLVRIIIFEKRKGYGTRALKEICKIANKHNINILAYVSVNNKASIEFFNKSSWKFVTKKYVFRKQHCVYKP